MISVLCAKKNSIYKTIPGIDVWDDDADQKELAYFCLRKVVDNGGIFEHPAGSSFFKHAGITKNIYSVDQVWWGFPARKRTYLFFHACKPLAYPILTAVPTHVLGVSSKLSPAQRSLRRNLPKGERSTTVLAFAEWMINCIQSAGLDKI
jgi:hypothetical protein